MPFRKVLFWVHLVAGLTCGIVIFIMSFTGAALALQPQVLLWVERDARQVEAPAPPAAWLGASALLAKLQEQLPDAVPATIVREHDPSLAVAVTLQAERGSERPGPQRTVWLNPYTGAIIGELDATSGARRFFRVMTDWHRYLAVTGEERTAARWVTGVSNAAFLLLAITGLYIWVPVVWSSNAFRAISLVRPGLRGKARDFNWHNVFGVWTAAVLAVLTFTALGISFPKTYEVIYSVTGMTRPPTPPGPPGGGGGRNQAARPGSSAGEARDGREQPRVRPAPVSAALDGGWALAEQHLPTWRSINMRLAQQAGQPLVFTMNDRERLNPMARSTLTVDGGGSSVVRWEPYESLAAGQRLRTWMRFGHTGELWGLPGQIIAGIASAAGCLLVWTGTALAWRRFTAWVGRRRRRDELVAERATKVA